MSAFCSDCGAQVGAQTAFCPNCGARAGQAFSGAPASAPAAAAASGGSGLKIILIVLGSLFVLGTLAVCGIYYAGHRLIQRAEQASGQTGLAESIRDAASRGSGSRSFGAGSFVKRDGCALLSKGEVESILGTSIEKADGQLAAGDRSEHCNYFVKPGTMEQDEDKLRQTADEFKAKQAAVDKLNASNLNEQARKEGVENLAKNFMRTMADSNGNGDVPVFSFTVERESGKAEFGAFRTANVIMGAAAKGANETIAGLGDRALMGPMDSVLSVLKGNTCITLNLTQVPNGKDKGIALAQKILSRI